MNESTLCWECENTNASLCPWFEVPPRPVKGWVATPTKVMCQQGLVTSYMVHECPRFSPARLKEAKEDD